MIENLSYSKDTIGSERNFGLVFATFFGIVGLYPLLKGGDIRLWALFITICFLLLSLFAPKSLSIPNRLWFKLGILLGSIIAPIIMGIIFFLTVTPIGIFMRLLGKDILNQKIKKSSKSYWIKRKEPIGNMKNQF